jgi:membrane-bound metal-dependent hydrolase YbcI (DUF457 family)
MDPLTHAAAGLLLARTGINRWSPLATPALVLSAMAPDLDALSAAFGPEARLHFSHALTHSLAALPILAAAAVAVSRFTLRFKGEPRWAGAIAAACLGVVLHLGLDAPTTVGARILFPFSPFVARLDYVAWFDAVVWAVLGLAVAGPFLSRLVGNEITSGSIRQKWPGRGAPVTALLFVCLYLWGRGIFHTRAITQLSDWNYAGEAALRFAALPDPINALRWRCLAETRGAFAIAEFNILRDFDPTTASIQHKPNPDPALDAAAQSPLFHLFLTQARFPLWRIVPAGEPEGAQFVTATDLTTGMPGTDAFEAEALVTARAQVLRTSVTFPKAFSVR